MRADICVYGATPSGIAAAIAAAREGCSVLLIEPTDWIGGTVSGGIARTDVDEGVSKAAVVGFADEFFGAIARDGYYQTQNNFWVHSYNGEPSINLAFLKRFLVQHHIHPIVNAKLQSVQVNDRTIVAAAFDRVGVVEARLFIDASYEGDLLAEAGCSYFIGREANAVYGESHNGVRDLNKSASQFPDGISPYVVAGDPASGLLPFVSAASLPSVGSQDGRVEAFCYRLVLTNDKSNKLPIPEPRDYDPLKYELLGRAIAAGLKANAMTDLFMLTDLQNQSKFDTNSQGPISLDYVSPECTEYVSASWSRREQILENIKDYTLGLFKWIEADARVASSLKRSVASYGFCADEFGTQAGFSPQLYIRESRRLIGDFVMNENHMTLANGFTDEVAFGYYTVDTHPVQNVIAEGQVKNEGPNTFNPPVGYKIPYRVLLPKTTECTNLLVTFCVSASHVAFSSMRVEPVLMALGQAAGIAASLAVHRGAPIQNISIRELKNKQDIYRTVSGRAIVLDVSGDYPNGFVSQTPPLSWDYRSSDFGYIGQGYLSDGNRGKGKALVFALNIPEPGSYRVCIKYPTGSSIDAQRSHNVPVTINHAAGVTYLTLDQKSTGQGGDWDDLGMYPFDQGWPSPNKIVLTTTGTESFVVVNAVKLVKM
ncbi:MAG: hypothetical protein DME76_15610 [Verrucomicrobia bacterium]|nr:MAG: hypothetical protein DME76_15610 [Verrucomicrobiota bacterium]